jgi:hypothetical protein
MQALIEDRTVLDSAVRQLRELPFRPFRQHDMRWRASEAAERIVELEEQREQPQWT